MKYIIIMFGENLATATFCFFLCYFILKRRKSKKLTKKYITIAFIITWSLLTIITTMGTIMFQMDSVYSLFSGIVLSLFTILMFFNKDEAVIPISNIRL